MKTTAAWVALAVTVFAATPATPGTIYKSTAADGSVAYSDKPPANGKIDKTFEFADLPSSSVPDAAPARDSSSGRQAATTITAPGGVTLFSAVWCGYCRRAKTYLAQRHIAYRNIDIDAPYGKTLFARAGGGGVPLLFDGEKHLRGFTPEGYDRFFGGR